MTGKERVKAVLAHKMPDRVPVAEQLIVSKVAKNILGRHAYTGGGEYSKEEIQMIKNNQRDFLVAKLAQDALDLYHEKLDLDAIPVTLVPARGEMMLGVIKMDENIFRYENAYGPGTFEIKQFNPDSGEFFTTDSSLREGGIALLRKWVKEMEKGIGGEIKYDPSQFEMIDTVNKKAGQLKALIGGQAMSIPMNQVWLAALIEEPGIAEAYLDCQLYWAKAYVKALAEHGVDLILGGGDLATNHGPVYSPMTFKEVVAPRFKKLVDYCHQLGVPYIFRTDGDTRALWSSFRDIGVDGLGEIDNQAGMDVGEIRNYFGRDFVIFGGVDCAKTLVFGPKEKISEEVRYAVEKAGPGGLILSTSNCVHWNVPAENYLHMLEAAKEHGKIAESKQEKEEKKEAPSPAKQEAAGPAKHEMFKKAISAGREEFSGDKLKIIEKKTVRIFLWGTLAVFGAGWIFGFGFDLPPMDWVLKCVGVELMLMVGAAVFGAIVWALQAPKKKFNNFSLLGLAFYLSYWIFYLSWDLEFFPKINPAFNKFLYLGWLISSIGSLVCISIGEMIAREREESGLGVWAVSMIFWFITFYFLFFATG